MNSWVELMCKRPVPWKRIIYLFISRLGIPTFKSNYILFLLACSHQLEKPPDRAEHTANNTVQQGSTNYGPWVGYGTWGFPIPPGGPSWLWKKLFFFPFLWISNVYSAPHLQFNYWRGPWAETFGDVCYTWKAAIYYSHWGSKFIRSHFFLSFKRALYHFPFILSLIRPFFLLSSSSFYLFPDSMFQNPKI